MKKQILTLMIGLSLLTFGLKAQHHEHNKTDSKEQEGMSVTYDSPESFQVQLKNVYKSTLLLNDAFVASEVEKVKEQANKVKSAVTKIDMKLLEGDAHMFWMGNLKELKADINKIVAAGNIVDQRKAFALFNQSLYKGVKALGINGGDVYYQYCPMANGNKGAYWLSDNKEIRNPYFGDSMLRCGSTKEVLSVEN